jgi:PPK2 family polyphosphate:nucleotide phosphotransferase
MTDTKPIGYRASAVPVGAKVDLSDYDPNEKGGWEKPAALQQLQANLARMAELQEMLYAQGKHSLLIVLQAMDAGGKDSTIRHVMDGFNPQGCHVFPFGVPTEEELAHDFLWRIHPHTPQHGHVSIFNRSHYEDVLVVRVNKLVSEDVWRARYDHINAFERLLSDSGVTIVKFFLHISKDEQKDRFEDRLNRKDKQWKFNPGDLVTRDHWDDYMRAFEDAIEECNTPWAPWYIVPANRKWYRNLVVSTVLVGTLENLDLRYPKPIENIDRFKIKP